MDFFDSDGEGLVDPRRLVECFTGQRGSGKRELALPRRGVVTFSPRMLKGLIEVTGGTRLEAWRSRNLNLFLGRVGCCPVALALSPCGAPSSVILLEEMIAFGVETIVFVGYCGSIQEGIGFGDIVLPTCAIREEGTSFHYLPVTAECKPKGDLLATLKCSLQGRGLPVAVGPVWTTDALYRETRAKIEKHRRGGALAVDMETSALFAVGAVRRIEMIGLLLVSDQLSLEAWRPGFSHPSLLKREKQVCRIIPEWISGLRGRE